MGGVEKRDARFFSVVVLYTIFIRCILHISRHILWGIICGWFLFLHGALCCDMCIGGVIIIFLEVMIWRYSTICMQRTLRLIPAREG